MKNVCRGQMAIWLEKHLEGIRDVEKTQAAGGVECFHSDCTSGALLDEGAWRNILGATRRMVADLPGCLIQCPAAQREEVRCHDLVVDLRRGSGGESFRDDPAQGHFARVSIVPERF
jgi:hypothetical protein